MYMNTYIMYACACMYMNTYIMKFIGYTYMHINKTMWLNAPPEPRAFYATESSVAYLAPGGLKSTPLERAGKRQYRGSRKGVSYGHELTQSSHASQPAPLHPNEKSDETLGADLSHTHTHSLLLTKASLVKCGSHPSMS